MSEKNNNKFLQEGTFENISREDFFTNQNNKIDSFGKCPGCEENTLDLETRVCGCGYNLNHDYGQDVEKKVNTIIEGINNSMNYRICSCGNKMGKTSIMCKECYWKNKINGNI